MRFERLIAIRLVSHDAAALAEFYVAALDFARGAMTAIAAEELVVLGVPGTGSRTSLAYNPAQNPGPQGDDRGEWAFLLEIDQFDPPGQPYPQPRASDDRLFQHFAMVTADLPAAWARVMATGGQPVSADGPTQLPPENGSVHAVKFRDPEGHPLELLAFPKPGDRAPAIDHSAIVVRDVAASIAFYQARGLTVGARTLNHGAAQAALDGLAQPRVDVVPLHPAGAGPHLELLGYRDPALRQENAWDVHDVAATRLVWEAAGPALITDPDGHLHQCRLLGTPRASR